MPPLIPTVRKVVILRTVGKGRLRSAPAISGPQRRQRQRGLAAWHLRPGRLGDDDGTISSLALDLRRKTSSVCNASAAGSSVKSCLTRSGMVAHRSNGPTSLISVRLISRPRNCAMSATEPLTAPCCPLASAPTMLASSLSSKVSAVIPAFLIAGWLNSAMRACISTFFNKFDPRTSAL